MRPPGRSGETPLSAHGYSTNQQRPRIAPGPQVLAQAWRSQVKCGVKGRKRAWLCTDTFPPAECGASRGGTTSSILRELSTRGRGQCGLGWAGNSRARWWQGAQRDSTLTWVETRPAGSMRSRSTSQQERMPPAPEASPEFGDGAGDGAAFAGRHPVDSGAQRRERVCWGTC